LPALVFFRVEIHHSSRPAVTLFHRSRSRHPDVPADADRVEPVKQRCPGDRDRRAGGQGGDWVIRGRRRSTAVPTGAVQRDDEDGVEKDDRKDDARS